MAVTASHPTRRTDRWDMPAARSTWDRGMWASIGTGFTIAAVVYGLAVVVHGGHHSSYRIDSQWSAFAGMFVLALAIERLLEPFSRYLGPDTDPLKQQRDEAAVGGTSDLAAKQAALQRGRQLTAIVVWGVAAACGFFLCSALDITLLEAIRAPESGQPPFWADLLVTGLVVSAGTKPLHDLVTSLQKSKDAKQDPAVPTGTGT